jgi:very-short-patch-repair endonuclease
LGCRAVNAGCDQDHRTGIGAKCPSPRLARGRVGERRLLISQTIMIARNLRRGSTDAQRRLRSRLCRQGLGRRFRRQYSVPPFVVDFACRVLQIATAADNSRLPASMQDGTCFGTQRLAGAALLEQRGFWNNEALSNTDGIIAVIRDECCECAGGGPAPTLTRSSAGEGMYPAPCPRQSGAPPPPDRRPA